MRTIGKSLSVEMSIFSTVEVNNFDSRKFFSFNAHPPRKGVKTWLNGGKKIQVKPTALREHDESTSAMYHFKSHFDAGSV